MEGNADRALRGPREDRRKWSGQLTGIQTVKRRDDQNGRLERRVGRVFDETLGGH